jgi:hypothetical protein
VSADPVLTRELQSLKDELTTARPESAVQIPSSEGPAASAGAPGAAAAPADANPPKDQGQLAELISELTAFVEDAEKNISAHPAMSVVAALLLGILIGAALARR